MAISSRRRLGFTLVELLVVITIIGMLVALLLPAVQSVRETARTTQCATNLGELAKAMASYDTSKGNFPGYIQNVKRGNTYATADYDAPSQSVFVRSVNNNETPVPFSWATMLLSRVERQDVWDQIVSADANTTPPIRRIDVFICPSDTDALSVKDRPALTYIANTGAWDRDLQGKPLTEKGSNYGDIAANGVFFDLVSTKIQNRLSAIKDGAATTILLSENHHKSYDTGTPGAPLFCWLASGAPGNPPNQGVEQQFGMVWVVNPTPQPGPNLDNQERINGNVSDVVDFPYNIPLFARPASNHRDGVNVAFCDSHVQYVASDIDYTVYQRLLTSNGAKCDHPELHRGTNPPNNDVIYGFRHLPPLSNQDF
jgi:prepilin-type N-terminal cleavage/methylation domain-containing protein/prepilin-type processing-associated H-X9-DG protein